MSLLQLPREIRQQIFSYVLTSPSGLIFLYDLQLLGSVARKQLPLESGLPTAEPDDSEPGRFLISTNNGPNEPKRLSLAFLRTCKQIYEDVRDLKPFWQNNTFHLSPSINDVSKFPAVITSQVQNVEMEFDMIPLNDKFAKQEQDLTTLRTWKSLKSITLCVWPQIQNEYLFWKKFEHCKNCWSASSAPHYMYFKTLRGLNQAGGTEGYLSHLQRQIRVPLGKRNFGVEGSASPRVSFSAEDGDPNKTLEDWANVFGGRLLLDGTVCYDNGALVQSAFVSDPDENDVEMENTTEANYILRIDAYICRLAIFFTEAKGEVVSKCAGKEAQRIYDTYSHELLDCICHDWGWSSSWSIEERLKMVEERTLEFGQGNKD